jgi:hypothetical protein
LENRKHERTGSIKLLLDKTPELDCKSGRKIFSQSINSSINLFSDDYQNDRSPKPTSKKFTTIDYKKENDPGAGSRTKYEYAQLFRGYEIPISYMKKKQFPEKFKVILGGTSSSL